MTCPVIQRASRARKRTAAAMSSGVPRRPSGARPSSFACMRGSARKCSASGVSIVPGPTALTVMPCAASSIAMHFVSSATAPFDAP